MDFDTDQQINQLRQTISVMELMCNSIDESIVLLNEKSEVKWCNSIFDRLVEQVHITILGKRIFDIFDIFDVKKMHSKNKEEMFSMNLNVTSDKWSVEEFTYLRNSKELCLQVAVTKCKEDHEHLFVVIIRDISEQKKIYHQLEHLAHYDLVTNLPNRLQLETFFKRELASAHRHNRQLAVFFIDLNKFKEINDAYGHSAGDLLLKIVSERLKTTVRDEDFVARYGGDEFIVVISEFDHASVAQAIAEKIKASLNSPYAIFGNTVLNRISIGVSFYPSDADNANDLIALADKRMYAAKKSGDDQIYYS